MLRDQAFYDEVAHNSQGESDAAGLEDVEFDDLLEPLHDEIGAEGENHDWDHDGNHPATGSDHVPSVGDAPFDPEEEASCNRATDHRRDNPACGNHSHLVPVCDTESSGRDSCSENSADNRMGGRDWCAKSGGNVKPESSGEERRHHQSDKDLGIGDKGGIDDPLFHCADNVASSD